VPLLAARADLLRRSGRSTAADAAYAQAIAASANAAQRGDLTQRRRRAITDAGAACVAGGGEHVIDPAVPADRRWGSSASMPGNTRCS
jgi:hypothetical protein